MDYIDKLELQTEEVEEIETLEKHTIINNNPLSVDKYLGHAEEFLALDGDYNDGFNELNKTNGLGISCIVSKEVKEARQDVNGVIHTKLKDRIDSEVNEIKTSLDNMISKSFISVTDYGALHKEDIDDRMAIQNAIDYLVEIGGGILYFPKGTYLIKTTNENNNGLSIKGKNIKLIGEGTSCIKATIDMDNLISLDDECHYLEINNMVIHGNKLAKYCLRGNTMYHPYMTLRNTTFQSATQINVNIATYVALIEKCIFNHGNNGLLIEPIGDNICTSTTLNSCYVNNMNGEYGYYLKNCMYTTLNSCACDNVINGTAYMFNHARGLTMNSCGIEGSLQPIKVNSCRGMSINTLYGLNNGSDELDYSLHFISGMDVTLNGIRLENNKSKYILGLTSNSMGLENITILDDSIKTNQVYYIPNYKFTNPIKFVRDETTKNETISCKLSELKKTFDMLPSQINHNITINITDEDEVGETYLSNKVGIGTIIIDFNNKALTPSTPTAKVLFLTNNGVTIKLQNGSLCQNKAHGFGEVATITNCKTVLLNNMVFKNVSGGKGGSCVSAYDGSIVMLKECSSEGTFGSDGHLSKLYNDGFSIINGAL